MLTVFLLAIYPMFYVAGLLWDGIALVTDWLDERGQR